jgi:hypothetical protein
VQRSCIAWPTHFRCGDSCALLWTHALSTETARRSLSIPQQNSGDYCNKKYLRRRGTSVFIRQDWRRHKPQTSSELIGLGHVHLDHVAPYLDVDSRELRALLPAILDG